MNKHIYDKPPLGVYVLKNTRKLGHILLIDDDQHAGKETKLPGYWIANVLIYKKYRHLGLGKIMLEQLLKIIPKKKQVNLFTNNPIAKKLYINTGFKQLPLTIIRHGKKYCIFKK